VEPCGRSTTKGADSSIEAPGWTGRDVVDKVSCRTLAAEAQALAEAAAATGSRGFCKTAAAEDVASVKDSHARRTGRAGSAASKIVAEKRVLSCSMGEDAAWAGPANVEGRYVEWNMRC